MFSKFYIKFNYKNIIPFNLKKKKLRVHANLIANKAVAAQGFFFGVKIKFWYNYYGINGLKKDNILLIKNSSNKRLSVFFISNFNMIEGRWALPKVYEEYYQRYWFLQKKKINLIRIYLIGTNNKIYSNIQIKLLNNFNKNIYKLNYFYNLKLFNNLIFDNNINIYYNKFLKNNYVPIIYNYKKKIKKIKLHNNLLKNTFNNIFDKWCSIKNLNCFAIKHKIGKKKKYIYMNIKQRYILKNALYKTLIKIKRFLKIYKVLYKNNKNNILFLFYKFYVFFRFLKIYKKSNKIILNKILNKNLLKLSLKTKNIKNNFNIKYLNIFKKNIKYIYVFKLYYNRFLKKRKIYIYNKLYNSILKKYNNLLNKKRKKNWWYFVNFPIFGKNDLLYILKNRRIKRNKYKKIRKLNYILKSFFFQKKRMSTKIKRIFKLKKKIEIFFNSRIKKKNLKKKYNKKKYNKKKNKK